MLPPARSLRAQIKTRRRQTDRRGGFGSDDGNDGVIEAEKWLQATLALTRIQNITGSGAKNVQATDYRIRLPAACPYLRVHIQHIINIKTIFAKGEALPKWSPHFRYYSVGLQDSVPERERN